MHYLKRKQSKNIEACVGYTRADAQVRQPSVGYVVEKFDTALKRVRRLVEMDGTRCADLHTRKGKTALQREYELESVVQLRINKIIIKIH